MSLPIDPLIKMVCGPQESNFSDAARRLRLSRKQLYRYRRVGLSVFAADRLACRAGLHPMSVWPEWPALAAAADTVSVPSSL